MRHIDMYRDGEAWVNRLKEEYQALIGYVQTNKANDNDWFTISSNKEGTKWTGKCWCAPFLPSPPCIGSVQSKDRQ